MNKIENEVIHDGSSTSSAEVNQQLAISESTYREKEKWIREIITKASRGKLKGRFISVSNASLKANEKLDGELARREQIKLDLYTAEDAVLHLELNRYHNSYYFSTRGSPARILTGQNVTSEIRDNELIRKITKILGCTEFEAAVVAGFQLVRKAFKDNLGVDFFSAEEWVRVKARELRVFNVGYATYIDFGSKRDETFHHLTTMATYTVSIEEKAVPLIKFLGNELSAMTHSSLQDEEGWFGRHTSATFKKSLAGGSLVTTQTLYLKDAEVDKKNKELKERTRNFKAETANARAVNSLSIENRNSIKSNLVRVDTVFYQPALAEWAAAFNLPVPKQGEEEEFSVRRLAPLFSDINKIRSIAVRTTFELGIFHLLLSPGSKTLNRLNNVDEWETEEEFELYSRWFKSSVNVDRRGSKFKINYKSVLTPNDYPLQRRIWLKHYIDLTKPPEFYAEAFRSRLELAHTFEERKVLTKAFNADTDRKSWKEIEAMESSIRQRVSVAVLAMRKSLSLVSAVQSKKKIAASLSK